jgi:glycosyltransferase involved in cell wall biosynthesis
MVLRAATDLQCPLRDTNLGPAMKILWVCGAPIVGGAERVTIQILRILHSRGHRIATLLRARSPVIHEVEALAHPVRAARFAGSLDALAIASVVSAIRDFRPEVVLATTPDEWVWSCLVPRILMKAPLVLARHMALRLAPGVRWLADARADAIVAVSDAVKANLQGRAGIRPELIHVILNPARFPIRADIPADETRVALRRSLDLPAKGRWLGFFGGNDPQKGIGDLTQVTARLRNDGVPLNLLVCGRTESRHGRTIEDWARSAGLEGAVFNRGEVTDVERMMGAVDAVVVATHQSLKEGLPLTAIEAMACGTPVVGYASGGIVEALGEREEGGLLAKPDDPAELSRQVRRLLNDLEFAADVARRGLVRARALFDPAHAADQYEQLFSSLCG